MFGSWARAESVEQRGLASTENVKGGKEEARMLKGENMRQSEDVKMLESKAGSYK